MKLQPQEKANLLNAAKKVYAAYTTLDFFKTREFVTQSGKTTLYALCQKAIASKNYSQAIVINGLHYQLTLKPGEDGSYAVHFSRLIKGQSDVATKTLNSYSDAEILGLFTKQEFTIQSNDQSAEFSLSNKLDSQHTSGGPGKIDLYRNHLVTLFHIISKLEAEEDISNLLVALATGSGKTYVQALWMLVLSVSGNNGIFAVPDKLVTQFRDDLKHLLPETLVDSMLLLRETGSNPKAHLALDSLKHPETKGQIIIGSSEYLLDKHYKKLEEATNRTFLSFDEQHLIMQTERRRVRLIELAKQKLCMFLTATPNQETYSLSGNKPVAIMSSGQKQEAGQGLFPRITQFEARTVSDRNTLKNYRFWTREFWQNIGNKILLALTNSIQEEQSSPPASLLDDLFYYHFDKEGETDARWRMQVPAARKMLCIVDDNETLVNLCHALEHCDSNNRTVYKDGNIIDRADVADFFGLHDADVDVVATDRAYRKKQYQRSLKDDEQEADITRGYNPSLKQQLKYTIFHNMMEYVLSDITGLDEIQHNQLRKNDFDSLQRLVLKNAQLRSAEYYEEKLKKEIDPEGAKEISQILAALSTTLHGFITNKDKERLRSFIDNWYLNNKLIDELLQQDWMLEDSFSHYAQNHLMMGIMTGMTQDETPVEESRPFSKLQQQRQALYDSEGILRADAKKRKHTSLEIVSDTSRESTFTPQYLKISEEVADKYFRLGFVGIYVSNKKTEGFSDRNLHTVINIAEKTLSSTNNPETQIQAIGRNRGLDATVQPAYIHSTGRKQKTTFNLGHLESDDYYPELFKAQKKYNSEYVKVLGDKVSKQIIAWVYTHVDDDETINPDRLKRQVLKFIAKALREINNKNSHQIQLSREQLTDIVNYAMKGLDREIASIKKPYRLSWTIRGLSYFLNFVNECYYTIKRIPTSLQMYYHSWFGKRDETSLQSQGTHADDVYIKIIQKTSFKNIMTNMSSILELRSWLGQKFKGIETSAAKSGVDSLVAETRASYALHQQLLLQPLLLHCVAADKQKQVAEAMAAFPNILNLIRFHMPLLEGLFRGDIKEPGVFQKQVLSLLREIPGLHELKQDDIVFYPEKASAAQELFSRPLLQTIAQSKMLQESVSVRLGLYIQQDFAKKLTAFVSYPNAILLEKMLLKDNNASLFAEHCLKRLAAGATFSPQFLFQELKSFFKLNDLKSLDEEMNAAASGLEAIQKQISTNIFACIDEEQVNKLANLISQQLIPLLVNLYPLSAREKLFAEASDFAKIKKFLRDQGGDISKWSTLSPSDLATYIFSKTTEGTPPEQLNPTKEAERVTDYVTEQFTRIRDKGIVQLFAGKIWSPSSWSLSPSYLYDKAIADLLQSDDFLNAISPLLPYDQWVKLKRDAGKNYSGLIQIARELIDKMMAKEGAALPSPQGLLALFNKHLKTSYQTSEQVQGQVQTALTETLTVIASNPIDYLSSAMNGQIANLGLEQVLPLLASFIKDDKKKQGFLNAFTNKDVVRDFLIRNREVLASLATKPEAELVRQVLILLNQLMPTAEPFATTDLHNPLTYAEQIGEVIEGEIQEKIAIAFLSSAEFREALKHSFNGADHQALLQVLSSDKNIQELAAHFVKHGTGEGLDKEVVIKFLKERYPSLSHIKTLDERINDFQVFNQDVNSNTDLHVESTKVASQMADSFAPVLFHKRFAQCLDNVLGFLNEQDLLVLFEVLGKKDPAAEVKDYLRFMSIIKEKDKAALAKEYLLAKEDSGTKKVIPAQKMLDTIKELIEEVLNCHCHYNNQDRTGSVGHSVTPKICSHLSSGLVDVTISGDHTFFNQFARKTFYIHGITRGLSNGGAINAAANQHKVEILQQVKNHILRPLWWSSNLSNAMHGFIKGCRDAAHSVVAAWYGFINTMKTALNWATRSTYFTISQKNPDSTDFNDTTFDFTHKVNALTPLDGEQAKQDECPVDVVTHVEDFVAKRPPRPGFFGGTLGRRKEDEPDDLPPSLNM